MNELILNTTAKSASNNSINVDSAISSDATPSSFVINMPAFNCRGDEEWMEVDPEILAAAEAYDPPAEMTWPEQDPAFIAETEALRVHVQLQCHIRAGEYGWSHLEPAHVEAVKKIAKASLNPKTSQMKPGTEHAIAVALKSAFATTGDERLWCYHGAYWAPTQRSDAFDKTAKLLDACGVQIQAKIVEEVRRLVLALCSRIPVPASGINVGNGFIAIEGDQWAFIDHDPAHGAAYILPYAADANATCPLWQQFLDETQPDRENQKFIQDLMGYILLGAARPHLELFSVFIGSGQNGKSVCLSVIEGLVGSANCSYLSLHEFSTKNVENMIGKLVNIGSEAERSERMQTSLFKKAVSGESILVEPKYRDHYTAKLNTALIFAVNDIPSADDRTDGLWRRMKVLEWGVTIENVDTNLPEKLAAELPGILNWAIEGAIRVARDKKIAEPASVIAMGKRLRTENNNAALFIQECANVDAGFRISKADAYAAYKLWCSRSGYKAMSKINFGREVIRTLKCQDDLKVSSHYVDINGLATGKRPDGYPFCIAGEMMTRECMTLSGKRYLRSDMVGTDGVTHVHTASEMDSILEDIRQGVPHDLAGSSSQVFQ